MLMQPMREALSALIGVGFADLKVISEAPATPSQGWGSALPSQGVRRTICGYGETGPTA